MYSKNKKSKNVLIVIFIILCGLLVSSFFVYKKINFSGFFLRDGIIGVTKIFKYPFNSSELISSNNYLQSEVNRLKNVEALNTQLESEIKSLRETLSLNSLLSDKVYVNASVVNRDLDYWNESLVIDKGSHDGISNDMAVVSNGTMVGITNGVSTGSSSVLLLSNSKFPISISVMVSIGEDNVYGILNNYSNGFYDIVGIVENIDIPEGSLVTTTGFGNKIPSGLVIGNVSSVTTDNFDLSKVVHVAPSISFDDIKYVSVVFKEEK